MGTNRTRSKRSRAKQKSSSSGQMAASKTFKDVLELGEHLVKELNLQPRGDTLGRWLGHHVAELMWKSEHAETTAERRLAAADEVDPKRWTVFGQFLFGRQG